MKDVTERLNKIRRIHKSRGGILASDAEWLLNLMDTREAIVVDVTNRLNELIPQFEALCRACIGERE